MAAVGTLLIAAGLIIVIGLWAVKIGPDNLTDSQQLLLGAMLVTVGLLWRIEVAIRSSRNAAHDQDMRGRLTGFRDLSALSRVLVLVPLALVPLGGLLGAIIGGIAVWVNLSLANVAMRPLRRGWMMMGIAVASLALLAIVADVFTSFIGQYDLITGIFPVGM